MGNITIPMWITGSDDKERHSYLYTLIATCMCSTNWEHNVLAMSFIKSIYHGLEDSAPSYRAPSWCL